MRSSPRPPSEGPLPVAAARAPPPVGELEGEYEVDEELLARREKQVETFKSSPDYLVYSESVQKPQRTHRMPRTPERKRKFSRRQWDGAVKQWKLKVHAESRRVTEAKTNQAANNDTTGEVVEEDVPKVPGAFNVITI